jgi:hypothetical protein
VKLVRTHLCPVFFPSSLLLSGSDHFQWLHIFLLALLLLARWLTNIGLGLNFKTDRLLEIAIIITDVCSIVIMLGGGHP